MYVQYRIVSPEGNRVTDVVLGSDGRIFGQSVRAEDGLFFPVIKSEGGSRAEAIACFSDDELGPDKVQFSIRTIY